KHRLTTEAKLIKHTAFCLHPSTDPKTGIRIFRSFLNVVKHATDSDDQKAKRLILLGFLQSRKSNKGEPEAIALSGLIRWWHFAVQSNNESLCSSIAACFASLLNSISRLLEFQEYGKAICRTLLHDDQLKLLDRGLSAKGHKTHVLGPCLRLLTEIVLFDCGSVAKIVYRQRDTTFQRLDLFLSIRKALGAEDDATIKGPSLREIALRYLFANLRVQSRSAKCYILSNTRIVRSLLQNVAYDPPWIVHKILATLRKDIQEDVTLPYSAKAHFFTDRTLGYLSTLYDYDDITKSKPGPSVRDTTHALLVIICTYLARIRINPDDANDAVNTNTVTALGLDQVELSKNPSTAGMPEQREILLAFLKKLRPYIDTLQGDLILECFRVAPSLIDGYFGGKRSFLFDPKLTATWVGYSRFLLAMVQLPVPKQLWDAGGEQNALGETLMNCTFPQPLTQKVLTRCLNQSSKLITFLTVRIINAAFAKFALITQMLRSETESQHVGSPQDTSGVIRSLKAGFCARCPEIRHVIGQFRSCPTENVILREAIARLLSSYYREIPEVALVEKLDISVGLSVTLRSLDQKRCKRAYHFLKTLELDHLLDLALQSPHMQWWHRLDKSRLTPFTRLLQIHVCTAAHYQTARIRGALETIGRECGVFRPDPRCLGLDILVLSLRAAHVGEDGEIYDFLDNTLMRLVRKPVVYYESMINLAASTMAVDGYARSKLDLLVLALAEQWPHLNQSKTFFIVKDVAAWLNSYMHLLRHTGSNPDILCTLTEQVISATTDSRHQAIFERPSKLSLDPGLRSKLDAHWSSQRESAQSDLIVSIATQEVQPLEAHIASGPQTEKEDHSGLYLWRGEEVQDAISDGVIGRLFLCLCSQHKAIRRESLVNARKFMRGVEVSEYSERQQTYLLVGELIETAEPIIAERPLPYFVGTLAVAILSVLGDPLHFMYAKVCIFLHRNPQWDLTKLPSYWVGKVILHEPTYDDSYLREVEWLLDILINGLRTPAQVLSVCAMARRYTHDELIRLRSSPFVPAKPVALPPAEEWMGSTSDQSQTANQLKGTRAISRGKNDESFPIDVHNGRRLPFEAPRRSSTVSGDIILGPPKSSFPSASGKNAQRAAPSTHDDQTIQNDRQSNQDRCMKDVQRDEAEEIPGQVSRPGVIQNRRSLKDDGGMWSGLRQTKPTGLEDKDKLPRRNADRDFGREREGCDDRRRERAFESHRRGPGWDVDHEITEKRNGPLRSREVASWARDPDKKGGGEEIAEKPRIRDVLDNDRRAQRGQERAWVRGAPQEDDPAWNMDGPEPAEKMQAATQEEFEEWRAQMKAEKEGRKVPVTSTVEQVPARNRTVSGIGSGSWKGKIDIPLDLGVGDDKFFDILGRPKKEKLLLNGHEDDLGHDSINESAKVAKPSKFSSLFNSNATSQKAVAAAPPVPSDETSNEDKAGFQRILNLLGQQQQQECGEFSLHRPLGTQNTRASPMVQPPPAGVQNISQAFTGSPSPSANAMPQTTDGEFLLNLMRNQQQGPPEHSLVDNRNQDQENTPGIPPFSKLIISPELESPPLYGSQPNFLDEPPRKAMAQQDKLNPHSQNQRGTSAGIYDLFNNPSRLSPAGVPPGLERRPPGMEHLSSGFGQLPQQQRQFMAPPPGFPPPQRGSASMAPGIFSSGPNASGMPPPPVFVNVGGPPPGFPSMSFGHDTSLFGNGGFEYGQGFSTPSKPRR
ncbi:MAG: hypothetical protein Q9163_005426, partial [Psora crenata]